MVLTLFIFIYSCKGMTLISVVSIFIYSTVYMIFLKMKLISVSNSALLQLYFETCNKCIQLTCVLLYNYEGFVLHMPHYKVKMRLQYLKKRVHSEICSDTNICILYFYFFSFPCQFSISVCFLLSKRKSEMIVIMTIGGN